MSTSRKWCQKTWRANKREAVHSLQAAELSEETSGSSDSSDSNLIQSYRLPKHQTNLQSAGYEDSACSEVDRLCRNEGFVHSNSESDTSDEGDLAGKLQTWAVDRGVTNSQLNKLLQILQE